MGGHSSNQEPGWRPWHDNPISSSQEDRLLRAPFAKHAAQLIVENHSPESSVVYGLEGLWGSGKSSVIALIIENLRERQDETWKVATFTPWATSGPDGLFAEFFAALSTVAPASGKTGLRRKLVEYADIARPLVALIPVAGAALAEAANSMEKRLEKPWNVVFEEISEVLLELKTPILIVVDDIDRLQSTELLDLMKVVRLLGRFPGVDFLLAYDEQTIVETLQDRGNGGSTKSRARAFMEKIVQYPLSIPPLLTAQTVRMLDSGLTEIVTPERVEANFDKSRFNDVILTTLPRQLTTPRAVARFLAQVREQFRVHDVDEVNAVDLILATFVRVQFPDVFAQLQALKKDLTASLRLQNTLSNRGNEELDWSGLMKGLESDEDRRDALAVLGVLFPVIKNKDARRAPAGRFAHPEYFDRYLAQAIPQGDIPDARINEALSAAAEGDDAILQALVLDRDTESATLVMGKIRERYPDVGEKNTQIGYNGPVTLEILSAAMKLLDQVSDDLVHFWSSLSDLLRYWAIVLLRRLIEVDPSCDVDLALLECSDIYRRANVVVTATRGSDQLENTQQEALELAMQREIARILTYLREHLRMADSANNESGIAYLFGLVADSSSLNELQERIKNDIEEKKITFQDVAARLVGFSYLIGGSGGPSRVSFDGELFTKLTGVKARSMESDVKEDWPDTTWARRRLFASRLIDVENGVD